MIPKYVTFCIIPVINLLAIVMNTFLNNLFNSENIQPPEECIETFEQIFADTMNAEWYQKNQEFEVVFLKDRVEHIATLSGDGVLLRYKINLSKELLPVQIISSIDENMEIMNVVLINEADVVFYEVIARSSPLDRYQILLDNLGGILSKKVL